MGKILGSVTQGLGLTADPNAGAGERAQANALQQRATRELEKLGIPSIEAQKLVLEQPDLVLSTLEEKLGPSAFEDLQVDPMLQEAELDALSDLKLAGEQGFTDEDKARIEALRSQVNSDEQARQASILQGMAQRGALDSGAQLAAQLSSSQNANQQASEQAIQMAAQQAGARRNALQQAAQLAGNMQNRQFQQGSQQAQAKDKISAFNASVSSRDTAARQADAQQRAAIANQQETHNKGLIQQKFQNDLSKATGTASALGNQAQQSSQNAQMQAQAAQNQAAATRGLLTTGAKAAFGGFADGGYKGMNYENGGDGAIIEAEGENYTGDVLPDRINEGEMVLNLDQQDRFTDLLKELAQYRRADEQVAQGDAVINDPQQETLMNIARGEAEPEDLDVESEVVEQVPVDDLEGLLGSMQEFNNGGISQPLDYNDIISSLANVNQPDPIMSTEPTEIDYSKMMSQGQPDLGETQTAPSEELQRSPAAIQPGAASVSKKEDPLKEARKKDTIYNLLDDLNQSLAYADAANPNANLKAMDMKRRAGGFEDSKLAEITRKSNEDYKKRQLDIQEQSAKNSAEERKAARAEKQRGEDRRQRALNEKLSEQDQKQVERYTDRAQRSDQYKKSQEMITNISTIKQLAKEANFRGGQSLSMLGPKIAKGIAGEVGVLTEQDVTRYVQSPDVRGKIRDSLKKMKDGKLTDVSYDNIMRLVDIMESKAKEQRTQAYERTATQLSKNSGLGYDKALEYLDPDYGSKSEKTTKEKAPVDQKNKQAMEWLKKNPNDPRADAIRKKLGL